MINIPPVIIVDYDPVWPIAFEELRRVLAATLGKTALTIEHVGSTSVSGLAAKPILDIDVVIPSPEQLDEAIQRLESLGYTHRGEQGIPGRDAFGRPENDVPRDGSGREWLTHHLYVCSIDGAELKRHLFFRDYLRAHPDVARAYGSLKKRLAAEFGRDREGYNTAKTAFVLDILQKAD